MDTFRPEVGGNGGAEVVENLHEPVFGGLQFSVRDPNGYVLRFLQEEQAVRS